MTLTTKAGVPPSPSLALASTNTFGITVQPSPSLALASGITIGSGEMKQLGPGLGFRDEGLGNTVTGWDSGMELRGQSVGCRALI